MHLAYWIVRYLLAAGILSAILVVVEYGKGTPTTADLIGAVAWAMLATAIFVGSKYWQARKNKSCSRCVDSVEP
jgi:hypothetical protein